MWADPGKQIALMTSYDRGLVNGVSVDTLPLQAKRPCSSVLRSEKGLVLPTLQNALERCLEAVGIEYHLR
jgi:dTDP-4-dehydrorhamnose reductase